MEPITHVAHFIVNHGLGSKLLAKAKHLGARNGTITLAEGTVPNHLLDLLCLNDTKKERVSLFLSEQQVDEIVLKLVDDYKMMKKHKGIAYVIPTTQTQGENSMYQLLTVIVDKGLAEDVLSAAVSAGSKGGTIINARGSSIYDTKTFFNMPIEPEKETILILAKESIVDHLIQAITQSVDLDTINGILYTQPVYQTYGLID